MKKLNGERDGVECKPVGKRNGREEKAANGMGSSRMPSRGLVVCRVLADPSCVFSECLELLFVALLPTPAAPKKPK